MVNFVLELDLLLKNGILQINLYEKQLQGDERRDKILENFRASLFRELDVSTKMVQSLIRVWGSQTFKAFSKAKNDQLNINKIVLIVFLISLWLFVVFGWLRHFNNLKNNSKWVNGFILLIPYTLIKENQHLKIFLKKKMNIKNLLNA